MLVPISKHTVVGWVFGSIFGLSVSLLTINLIQHPNYKWSILHKSDKSAFHGHAHSHRDLEDEVGPDDIVVFHKNDSVHHHQDEDLSVLFIYEHLPRLILSQNYSPLQPTAAKYIPV